METILSIRELSFGYNRTQVLKDISLSIPQGCIYGYLGRNGAGKSTTIQILLGLLPFTRGSIRFHNTLIEKESLLLRSNTGSMIEEACFYPFLTVKENLIFLDKIYNMEKTRIPEVLSLVGLTEHADKKSGNLSSGLKQRLGLAMALFHRPEMLILDEPLNALDPQGIYELRLLLQKMNKEEGTTIFFSSHILEEVEKIADIVGVIHNGEIVFEGDIKVLLEQQKRTLAIKVNDARLALTNTFLAKHFALKSEHLIEGEIGSDETFAQTIKCLAQEKIAVYDIVRKGSILEEAFMDLTRNI